MVDCRQKVVQRVGRYVMLLHTLEGPAWGRDILDRSSDILECNETFQRFEGVEKILN